MDNIREKMKEASLYELLAEEAVELAHAALKYARVIRGENPTPISAEEAKVKLTEEFSDVILSALVLDMKVDHFLMEKKHKRWNNRLDK